MPLTLRAVETLEDSDWIRVQRNRPELMKYFGQDHEITAEEHARWWSKLDKSTARLYVVVEDGKELGYAGLTHIKDGKASFGVFILPESQGGGRGRRAMELLLAVGFGELGLQEIYSDVIDYAGEDRFAFYEGLGFSKRPPAEQTASYKKGGRTVPAIKFFMRKETWQKRARA